MISPKKLAKMAARWMKSAGVVSKRISLMNTDDAASSSNAGGASTSKGYFAVYSIDRRRFAVPLKWLNNDVFGGLLRMAEEEFGLPGDGPITLPFDCSYMEEIMRLMERRAFEDLKGALLLGIAKEGCSSYSSHLPSCTSGQQHLIVC